MTQSAMEIDLRFAPAATGRWRNWWQSRLRTSDSHRLTLHNVYVLPTRAGWMMLVTVAVLMLATINYQLNLGYVLIFLLMGAGVVGLYLAHRAMTRVTLELDSSQALKGIAGEDVEVAIAVITDGGEFPGETKTENLVLQIDAIGSQPLPLLTCETRYPLGLLRLWSVWRIQSEAQIEPPNPASQSESPSKSTARMVMPSSAISTPQLDPIKDDFRAYRVGDAPRDLLWKSVAKRPDSPSSWGVRERDPSVSNSDALRAAHNASAQSHPPVTPDQHGLQGILLKRDQLLLCILLAIAMPFFLHLNFVYPLMATVLIAARFWITTSFRGQAPKWLQLPLIAGLGAMIWLQFRTFNGIEPSVSACVGLLGIKALELPKPKLQAEQSSPNSTAHFSRDRWVLVFLALFTLAAHFLVSQSLLSSVFVVLGLIGLIYVLVDAHSHRAISKTKLRTTALLVLLGAPIMLVLFFLFPRFAPLWTLETTKTSAVSGLSNTMRVGDISQITLDNRIILRLELGKTHDENLSLASKDIYLRGPVLPEFDGRTWHTYQRSSSASSVELDYLAEPPISYTKIEDGKRTASITSPYLRNTRLGTSTPYLEAALRLPAGSNPRTRQYVQGLRDDARFKDLSPNQLSELVLTLFRTGGYRYSLEPGVYGEHSTDELLFDRKLGFCEHYAASFVITMRMLGVPARVVTGYQGAEATSEANLFVVRNRHAHAWAEYWDAEQGWQRADPTAVVAPARIQNSDAFNQAPEQIAKRNGSAWTSPLLSPVLMQLWKARQQWDAGSYAWERWMQNYNQGAQMAWLKNLGFDNPSWKDLVQLLDAALIALFAIGAAVYVFKGKRKTDPWLLLLQAARDKALRAGLALAPNASPRDIAQALPPSWPNRLAALAWLHQLERQRYQSTRNPIAPKSNNNTPHVATLKRRFKSDFCAAP
jgi:protein-glutamine gamma-glutamyltransferase